MLKRSPLCRAVYILVHGILYGNLKHSCASLAIKLDEKIV